jgi:ribosome biogenesis GTPase
MSNGLITASFGRNFSVEYQGTTYQAVTKGKKTEYVVGDEVELSIINAQQAQISRLLPRRNLIYRSDHNRSKIIASNLDQLLIVIAVKPNFNLNFLDNCLISAESCEVSPLIVINKTDLAESPEFAHNIKQLYQDKLGYPLIAISAENSCASLKPWLVGKRSLLIGQSGVGKSTITNQIYPAAQARTATIAKFETSGCHTTTNASLYHLDASSDLIDCPGLQEFGLYHLEVSELANHFPEMRKYLGECRFNNCLHLAEPGCAINQAMAAADILPKRYECYRRLALLIKDKKHY